MTKVQKARPGRPRSDAARNAILEAARTLLEEGGLAAVTVDAIAARSKASKRTIYRWWPNRWAVLMDAFLNWLEPSIVFSREMPPTGSVALQVRSTVKTMRGPTGRTVASLIAGSLLNEQMAEAFRARFLDKRRQDALQTLQRGVDLGEFRDDLDLNVAADMIYGAIYFRLVITGKPLDRKFEAALVAEASRLLDSGRRKGSAIARSR